MVATCANGQNDIVKGSICDLVVRVPAGKQAVFINVDETSISLARPDLKGNIVPGKCSLQRKGKRTRGALTHVASICNRSDIQPCLPQVILSNTRVVSQKLAKSLLPLQPETVRLVRGKTGWSTAASFVEYLKMLRDALSLWPEIQPILVMDCAPAHLADSVIEAANNQGFFTAVCPAGLTPLLQPLDVYCFQGYKHYLAEKTRDAVDLSMSSRMQILFGACTTYLSRRSWKFAFGRLQLTDEQTPVSRGLQDVFPAGLPTLDPQMPTHEDLEDLFPSRRTLNHSEWIRVPLRTGRLRLRV
ncbi:unnamed protein product [Symbiodinium sp. CCMP2592]|nr:unnamed protein product [Symbiodinium sp. CCMP2592]